MKKLLVTGTSGLLGWNICHAKRMEWDVYGVVFSHYTDIPGVTVIQADIRDFLQLKKIFQEVRPDAVIHTAAITDPNFCQAHRTESQKVNVEASLSIAGLCSDYETSCIFMSTDLVFNGFNAPYGEYDPVCPVSYYGEQKAAAEERMRSQYPLTVVCRLPLMFGAAGSGAKSFIQPMIKAAKDGRPLRLFTDEFRTPVNVTDAVQGIFMALNNAKGIIHLGGRERISRFDFGCLLMDTLAMGRDCLIPCRQKDAATAAPRPPDVSLNSERAFAMGFNPLPLAEGLKELLKGDMSQ